jgi:23S rRNA (guanosine2251-2'-O)-methyltransferase
VGEYIMQQNNFVGGIHAVEALLKHSSGRLKCLHIQRNRHDKRIQPLLEMAEKGGIKVHLQLRENMDKFLPELQHQGVIAECLIACSDRVWGLEEVFAAIEGPAFFLVLDGVQDPHNLGACLRVAAAAGAHAVIAPKDRAVGLTTTVRKVACGAAEVIPFIPVTNLARSLAWLKEQGVWLFGAAERGETSLFKADLRGPIAWVLGAEGTGLRRLTQDCCDHIVQIPTTGALPSLNVAVAAGICLFEALRQRQV